MRALMPPINTPDGTFHAGNPATGVRGTMVTSTWANDVQDSIQTNQKEILNVLAAAGMLPDAAKTDQFLQAMYSLFRSCQSFYSQVFTTSGIFTVPEGVTELYITATGAGGGGGGAAGNNSGTYCPGGGGGGDAGEFVYRKKITVIPGEKINIVIGAGGIGGQGGTITVVTGKPGGDGGSTQFGRYLTLAGGKGGEGGDFGSGGLAVGGASDGQDGYSTTIGLGMGGSGASSPFGIGGGGPRSGAGTGGPGKHAKGYGAGGSGAGAPYRSKIAAQHGGDGAPGMLMIEY